MQAQDGPRGRKGRWAVRRQEQTRQIPSYKVQAHRYRLSMAARGPKAQHEPQSPWFLTGLTCGTHKSRVLQT